MGRRQNSAPDDKQETRNEDASAQLAGTDQGPSRAADDHRSDAEQ